MNTQQRSFLFPGFLLLFAILLSGCNLSATPAPLPPLPPFASLSPASVTMEPTVEKELPTASMALMPPASVIVQASPTETQTITPTDLSTVCIPPNGQVGWGVYTVQANNTLFSLAKSTNTTVQDIQQANCRDVNDTLIYVGQPLYLPFIPAPLPPVAATITIVIPLPPVVSPTAPPPGDPRIDVDPGSGPAGTIFTFRVEDFDPFEVITIRIEDSNGNVIDNFTVTVDANGKQNVEWKSLIDLAVDFYAVRPFKANGAEEKNGTFVITQ